MTYPIDLSNFLVQKRRKLIPTQLFLQYNARLVNLKKDQVLVEEGDPARDFLQVEHGQVKMYIINPDGQEFTQGIFNAGESFGEPALLGRFNYPSSAMATMPSKVWRLPRAEFLQLLQENFEIHLKLDQVLCKRLQYKTMILTEVSSYDPEHRLNTLLKYFKSNLSREDLGEKMIIPFTRQQLADMTGLRVETVIRTIKKMEKEGKLELEGHKIRF
ncbi:MAG: Crp/Fnr family transcriptional regulator [Cyclobacteriaceae bacterium]|nr:Crp/Fnr family transcriptional regulator [Cyclobacteriaceae bacterium]MDH4294774.1 Crp/Fnr family transcriptional regulator [Cyclobacteriaceae bacterium]MDH5248623.1 Crp/Fnr family transcriptional regulator [Cyclobacteriaceae bacterium]